MLIPNGSICSDGQTFELDMGKSEIADDEWNLTYCSSCYIEYYRCRLVHCVLTSYESEVQTKHVFVQYGEYIHQQRY
jgi:hypothetical protein